MRKTFFFLLTFWVGLLSGQTSISGIINTYDTLVAQNRRSCYDELQTNASITYNSGELLLLISTAGATYDTTNSGSFGSWQTMNGAGQYAFAYVQNYQSGRIDLDRSLDSLFQPGTQIIRVPEYGSAVVQAPGLRGKPYDGQTGGILVLKADRLELRAAISAEGIGYPGGKSLRNMGYSCGESNLFYPSGNNGGAPKGMGPAQILPRQANGRGPVTLGGGGGNNHNAGGGGGGNMGVGGEGGREWSGCSNSAAVGGLGGRPANSINNRRIFMGGGGGSGHNNLSNFSSEGGAGGGIIILLVDTLLSPNNTVITASGANGKSIVNSGAEGAGGGGAGGAILIRASQVIGSFGVVAEGGDGGRVTSGTAGPGGGAGGGLIALSSSFSGANVSTNVKGGRAGDLGNGNNYGATSGTDGVLDNAYLPASLEKDPIDFFPSDTALCADQFTLSGPANGPYLWSTGQTSASISISSSGQYWLQVGNGACATSDTIQVKLSKPVAFSLGPDTTLCPDDSLILQGPRDTSYVLLWDDGSNDPQRTVSPGATYWLVVQSDSCRSTDSIDVAVAEPPRTSVFPFKDTLICLGDDYQVDLRGLNGTVLWQDSSKAKQRSLKEEGWYWLAYSTACFDIRDSLFLQTTNCDSCRFTVANSFTPNSDGLNDRFKVFFGCELDYYSIEIADRWGGKVFSSKQRDHFWDGNIKGQAAPSGTYVYKVKYRVYNNPELQVEHGVVHLIR